MMSIALERFMVRGKFYMVGVFALIGLIIICLAILLWLKRDVQTYILLISPLATALVSQVLISKQVDDVKAETVKQSATLDRVEHQTNGLLTKQFDDLKSHIDDAVSNDE